jgi:CRISPR-associated exonuclease Cas4
VSSSEEGGFTVVDLKRYAYCPRIVFITSVLHLDEKTSEAMEVGGEEHDERFITPLLARLHASKVMRSLELESRRLGFIGKIDYIIVTKNRELVPIEVKWSDSLGGKAKWDHRVQLAAYALLLEENLGSSVKRGYVYYLRDRRLVEVLIDEDMKSIVKRILTRMHEMVLEDRDPGIRVPLSKCRNCGYLSYCRPSLNRSNGPASLSEPLYKEKSRNKGPEKRFVQKASEEGQIRRKSNNVRRKPKYNNNQQI